MDSLRDLQGAEADNNILFEYQKNSILYQYMLYNCRICIKKFLYQYIAIILLAFVLLYKIFSSSLQGGPNWPPKAEKDLLVLL